MSRQQSKPVSPRPDLAERSEGPKYRDDKTDAATALEDALR